MGTMNMFNEFRSSKSWEISPKVRKMPMKIAFAFFVLSQTLSFLIDLLPILGIYCMIISVEFKKSKVNWGRSYFVMW